MTAAAIFSCIFLSRKQKNHNQIYTTTLDLLIRKFTWLKYNFFVDVFFKKNHDHNEAFLNISSNSVINTLCTFKLLTLQFCASVVPILYSYKQHSQCFSQNILLFT